MSEQQINTAVSDSADEKEVEEIVHVSNMHDFIMLMQDWHAKQVATIEHFNEIPPGTEVAIEGEESFKLEGNARRGFQLGLSMALSYLGTLPFSAELDPDAIRH